MTDTSSIGLRDVADAWHVCVAIGLATPTAAVTTETLGALLAVAALAHGHHRPAATLAATTVASIAAAALLH